jgi:hypothetical protein
VPSRLTTQQKLDRAVTEDALLREVLAVAKTFGWLAHHTRPAWSAKGYRTPVQGDKGFCDLVLAHPTRGVIFVELKREQGVVTPEQTRWLETLRAAGQRAEVWRPSMRGEIVATLAGAPARVAS